MAARREQGGVTPGEVLFTILFGCARENDRGEAALALEAAPELHLERLVGPLFSLGDYRDAIAYAMSAGRLGAVKVAFDLRGLRA